MGLTKSKGDIGQTIVMAQIMLMGHKVALPVGEDWRYDLIVLKDGKLLRVQCKYVTSDGNSILVPCRSCNNWKVYRYTDQDFDYLAVYDKTTDQCYYVPSKLLGTGRNVITLRLTPPLNKQKKRIIYATDFKDLKPV